MDKYKVLLKRTDELCEDDWQMYKSSFNEVFKKELSVDYFKKKYFGSALGYSYHGVLMFEKTIVGMFSVIPRKYTLLVNDEIVGLACDAFILAEHRKDDFFLKRMADVVIDKFTEEKVYYFISIPNEIAYPYWIYYGGWKDIGTLDYFILPLKVSKLLGKYKFLDVMSYHFLKIIVYLSSLLYVFSSQSATKDIRLKKDDLFISNRYTDDYVVCKTNHNTYFTYRIVNENGVRTAYLIDCHPLNKRNITTALKTIIRNNKSNVDVVLFVGKIEKSHLCFFKVPNKYIPRVQPFIVLSSSPSPNKLFFDIASWDLSLADFDNR